MFHTAEAEAPGPWNCSSYQRGVGQGKRRGGRGGASVLFPGKCRLPVQPWKPLAAHKSASRHGSAGHACLRERAAAPGCGLQSNCRFNIRQRAHPMQPSRLITALA